MFALKRFNSGTIMIILCHILLFLSLSLTFAASKTLEEIRAELLVFEDGIINTTLSRLSLLQQTSDEEGLITQRLAGIKSHFEAPPDQVFFGSNHIKTKTPPYIFYQSDTNKDFGSHQNLVNKSIFDFVSSQLHTLPPSSSQTLLPRAILSTKLLSLTSERVSLGIDVAKAKLDKMPSLASLKSPDRIRELLTNKTQEELVRGRVQSKAASLNEKFDIVGLFNMYVSEDIITRSIIANFVSSRELVLLTLQQTSRSRMFSTKSHAKLMHLGADIPNGKTSSIIVNRREYLTLA